jgi:hypothetical protein
VLLNGATLTRASLPTAQRKPLSIDVSAVPIHKVLVMELRLERETQKFSDGRFSVRWQRFGEPAIRLLMRAARSMLRPAVYAFSRMNGTAGFCRLGAARGIAKSNRISTL